MDRPIARRGWARWGRRIGLVLAIAGAALLLAWWWHAARSASDTQRIDAIGITLAAVARERFDDHVPLRAQAEPLQTVFIDAVEGGRVERVLVEDGAAVFRGQPLVRLANAALQLDIISREAQVTEQLNTVRALELAMQANRLERENARAEIEYRLLQLRRDLVQQESLAAAGFLSVAAATRLREDLDYQSERRRLANENERQAGTLQAKQLRQLRGASRQLESHLALARQGLQELTVSAPVAGTLSAFALQPGQTLARGARIGQIDVPGEFKLTAGVDQFYLGRVAVGQAGSVEIAGEPQALRVTRITPQVTNGEFRVELKFDGAPPDGLRRGQTLPARLALGDAASALVLPNAAFIQDSAGAFVFVLDADGSRATRRDVRLGRRNPQRVEVLDGLREGERVIVSSYATYAARQHLVLER